MHLDSRMHTAYTVGLSEKKHVVARNQKANDGGDEGWQGR